MTTKDILDFLQNNPVVLYILLGSFVLLVIVVAIQIFRGREFISKWFSVNTKTETPNPVNEVVPVSATFTNIVNTSGSVLPQEQLNLLASIIAEKTRGPNTTSVTPLFKPPELPERVAYILAARRQIEGKVSGIVFEWGGGWMGMSMVPFDSFWDKVTSFHLIPEKLEQDIMEFFVFVEPYLSFRQITDDVFLDIQYLASHINSDLDMVLANTSNNKRGFEDI